MNTRIGTVALLLLLGACASKEPVTYPVRGVFVMPAFNGEAAIIDHETIPGFMDAMRMTFRVDDASALYEIQRGMKIVFDLVVTEDGYYLTNLKVLPDSTVLDLSSRIP